MISSSRSSRVCAWRFGPSTVFEVPADDPIQAATDAVYSALKTDRTDNAKTLCTHTRGGALRIVLDGVAVTRAKDAGELAPLVEGMMLGVAVRSRRDCLPLHGATVVQNERTILIVGDKGSGKSTLSMELALLGACFCGDEIAFVRYEDQTIEPFPKAVTIKHGAFELAAKYRPDLVTWSDRVRGPVRYLLPKTASLTSSAVPAPGLILLPEYDPSALQLRAERVSPPELAMGLIRQVFGGLERHPATLDTIAALSRVPCYAVRYGRTQLVQAWLQELPDEP